jgi:hypothetical protein
VAVAKLAIRVVVIETIARNLPQTGGGILDHQLLDDIWHDRPIRPGIPFLWAISHNRTCRFPVSGQRTTLKVCGRRTQEGKQYCAACLKLAYYKPEED